MQSISSFLSSRATRASHHMICILALFWSHIAFSADDPGDGFQRTVLSQKELYPLTLYMVHVDQNISRRPVAASMYQAYAAVIQGLAWQYKRDDGLYDLSRIPNSQWHSVSIAMRDYERELNAQWNLDPNQSQSSLAKSAIPALGGFAVTLVAGPVAGVGAGVLLDVGVDKFDATYRENRAAHERVFGEQYFAVGEPAATLHTQAGFLFMTCGSNRECANLHDSIFAPAMDDVSIRATADRRLQSANSLRDKRAVLLYQEELSKNSEPTTSNADKSQQADEAIPSNFDVYWTNSLYRMAESVYADRASPTTAENIGATTTLLVAMATISKRPREAQAIALIGDATVKVAETFQKYSDFNLQTAAAAVNWISAAMSVASLLSSSGKSESQAIMEALAEISRQLAALHQDVVRGFYTTNSGLSIYANRLQFGQEEILSQLAVIKDGIDWSSRFAHYTLRQEAISRSAQSRIVLERLLDRCDARNMEKSLETAAAAACIQEIYEEAAHPFTDGVGRAAFTIAGNLPTNPFDEFRFHDSYGALLQATSLAVLNVADPYYWEQYSLATLRLFSKYPPETEMEKMRRLRQLRSLLDVGERSRSTLSRLYDSTAFVTNCDAGNPAACDGRIHDYFSRLRGMAVVLARQAPAGEFGQSALQDLDTLPLEAERRSALELQISASKQEIPTIRACFNAKEESFKPRDEEVQVAAEFLNNPFLGAKNTWLQDWNKAIVDSQKLPAPQYLSVVPPAAVWGVVENLGTIEVCLAEFRPTDVSFTSNKFSKWVRKVDFEVGAKVEVYFKARPEFSKTLGFELDKPYLLAAFSGKSDCKSEGYRLEQIGYPHEARMSGVFNHARRTWSEKDKCLGSPIVQNLVEENPTADEKSAVDSIRNEVSRRRESLKAPRLADMMSLGDYRDASDRYVEILALLDINFRTDPIHHDVLDKVDEDTLVAPQQFLARMIEVQAATGQEARWLQSQLEKLDKMEESTHQLIAGLRNQRDAYARYPDALPYFVRMTKAVELLEVFVAAYSAPH